MNEKEKREIDELIEQHIEKLKKEIPALKELTKPISPDVSLGRLTRMEAIGEKSVNEAALRNSEARLRLLEAARLRLNDDEFGICLVCEEDIPMGRMRVMPESTVCVACLNKAESDE